MAKGDPNSVTVQYKVHLKPTEVGLLVMKRLERPHLDVSPELRRFIELGYAAEQAGFMLDGTVLRHAGRLWDIQPDLSAPAQSDTAPVVDKPSTGQTRSAARLSKPKPASAAVGTADTGAEPVGEKGSAAEATGSSLRANLRGISG
jgi:hypothetical protein